MAKLQLKDVRADPTEVARTLEDLDCIESASVLRLSEGHITFQITVLPCEPVFISEGYPIEKVNILLYRNEDIHAIPKSGKGRRWKHRHRKFGVNTGLCLWYPHDPPELRWTWNDGLEEYVRIVARHLIYEEYWRRTGQWPVEDAPHGDPANILGKPMTARGSIRG